MYIYILLYIYYIYIISSEQKQKHWQFQPLKQIFAIRSYPPIILMCSLTGPVTAPAFAGLS
jgi:hypothetical protein